ncbi:SlyX family protein [Colwellia psychrerythraea]|uniref:Protein SlyX homolog n=1 Tax=Colwellia psychrerythraea TaxID=28229 RepID=A0A099KG61_COLPS|nr:SlyX family protein [Colwellia psychrerythraea]KGJ89759.1 Protein slyX [Colwellia psychrerythraea]
MANAEITLSAHNPNVNYVQQLEERVDALESRNVFQDDVIDQLSEELAAHQHEISDLKHQIQLVANRLKDAGSLSGDAEEVEPPPPHY